MKTLGLLLAVLGSAGCSTVVEVNPPPLWKAPVVDGWRLTERTYGTIEDSWISAGDGVIPPDSQALLYEPIFRRETKSPAPSVLPGFTPCLHRIRLKRETPEGMGVGETARVTLEIERSTGSGHLVRIEGAYPGIVILEVRGATPLAGHPGVYAVDGTSSAQVRFTSKIAGRGGLEVELLGETGMPASSSPPASLAGRR